MSVDFGSPGLWMRPLVMMSIRKAGSRLIGPPIDLSIGLRAGPIPPSRLPPWQDVQLAAYRVAPLLGSPGKATVADGDGELSARVVIAVSASSPGTATASSTDSFKPLLRPMARQILTSRYSRA